MVEVKKISNTLVCVATTRHKDVLIRYLGKDCERINLYKGVCNGMNFPSVWGDCPLEYRSVDDKGRFPLMILAIHNN